jgi:hypothetical protein
MNLAHVVPQLSGPLHLGSHGEEVRELQRLLNENQIGPMLNTDGRFGKATHKALVEFQRRKGLKCDGVVGPATAKLLGWGYHPGRVLPYVIAFEEPPLPPLTPPLKVLVVAILVGLKPVHTATRYAMFSTPTDKMSTNMKQIGFLDEQWSRLEDKLNALVEEVPDGTMAAATMRRSLETYVEFSSDFAKTLQWHARGGYMWRLPDLIHKIPVDVIVGTADRVLRGEQTITMALAQLQMAFQNLKYAVDQMPHTDANGVEY